jgi:transposase
MPRSHRPYDAVFRQQAVELAQTSGKPYRDVARDLGVSVDTLRAWRQQTSPSPTGPVIPSRTPSDLERENQRLRRERAYTQRQREILKKPWPSVRRSPSCWTVHTDRADGHANW